MEFMQYNTLSFQEILKGAVSLPMGNWVRNKEAHIRMFKERMQAKSGTKGFLEEATKGVKDIMKQQVSQGKIGDMSRVARISSMCFTRGTEGGTFVVSRRSKIMLNLSTGPSTGCPAVRCVMILCQASQ